MLGGEGWKVMEWHGAPDGRVEEDAGAWQQRMALRRAGVGCPAGWWPTVVLDVTLAAADGTGHVDWRAVGAGI